MAKTLLIGGSGRSGTTILNQAMAKHPDLTDVPEWRFTTDPDGIIDFYTQSVTGLQSPFHFDVRRKRLHHLLTQVSSIRPLQAASGVSRVRNLGLKLTGRNVSSAYARISASRYSPNFKSFIKKLMSDLKVIRYQGQWAGMHPLERGVLSFSDIGKDEIRGACRRFLHSVATDVCIVQNAKYHLEKNTWNILCWDQTREVLPDAKLVHIVRDPRDVVASYIGQPWSPRDPEKAALMLRSIMKTWRKISSKVPTDSYLEIRLEDLTRDPHATLQTICRFWELDWSDELMRTEFTSSSFGRWKSDLTSRQAATVNSLLEGVLEDYEYN